MYGFDSSSSTLTVGIRRRMIVLILLSWASRWKLGEAKIIGVDLFAGAGGMSLGAQMAGIKVVLAVEKDPHVAQTYAHNHPHTKLITGDVTDLMSIRVPKKGRTTVLFGGPPCQGFSTSNQRTRSRTNPTNWLFKEFVRIVRLWGPDWVVFENVRGIIETEHGLFRDTIVRDFEETGYTCSYGVLCASDFGVPQVRSPLFSLIALTPRYTRGYAQTDNVLPSYRPPCNCRPAKYSQWD